MIGGWVQGAGPADYSSIFADPADIWSRAAREPSLKLDQTPGLEALDPDLDPVTLLLLLLPVGLLFDEDGGKRRGGLLKAATPPPREQLASAHNRFDWSGSVQTPSTALWDHEAASLWILSPTTRLLHQKSKSCHGSGSVT